jgi:putative membrane protein
MKTRDLFTEADLEAIRRATAKAEGRTSGEIVTYVVGRVDDHDEGRWKGATLGALATALAAGLAHWLGGLWGGAGVPWIAFPSLAGAAAGYLLTALLPGIERRLISEEDLERRVRVRAAAAFLEEEVWNTRERTGVLILIALFERRAVILADSGIHRNVEPETWTELVDELVAGIKAGRAAGATIEAVEECGRILERGGVERRADDVDELADAPRVRER